MIIYNNLILIRYKNQYVFLKKDLSYDLFEQKELESLVNLPFTLGYAINRRIVKDYIEYYWLLDITKNNIDILEKLRCFEKIVFINITECFKYKFSRKVTFALKSIHHSHSTL